jgi:hypothetical protein
VATFPANSLIFTVMLDDSHALSNNLGHDGVLLVVLKARITMSSTRGDEMVISEPSSGITSPLIAAELTESVLSHESSSWTQLIVGNGSFKE